MKIPLFSKLCKDENWSVRKVCAETIVSMAEYIDIEERYDLFFEFQYNFLKDVFL